MRKIYCLACGTELVQDKIDSYDYKNGQPIWMLICPNYYTEKTFLGINYMDEDKQHTRCLENAVFSSFNRKNRED